jgi:dihydropteroate synthase/2-amino-4-hydroxy-6-hydroxymethyldihydropteridine diphosphokinase
MAEPLHTVYIALGTNLGRRAENLRRALAAMLPEVQLRRASPVYETPPWGYADQPAFFNQVIESETRLSPAELLAFLKQLETRLGRQAAVRNGPRQIDLDILLYDDLVVETRALTIPHPRLIGRAFVLVPFADLAPDLVHPVSGQPIRQLAAETDPTGMKRVMEKLPPFGSRTFVMGVINLTPDSFSGDGVLGQPGTPVEVALRQARLFVEVGADILDVGGESTRPGAAAVSEQEELERVVPVVAALSRERGRVLISIDTYKAQVAEAALRAGADWINDIWGLKADPRMAEVVAHAGAPVIVMHNRLQPESAELRAQLAGRPVGAPYENLLNDVRRELLESVTLARAAGIPDEDILLDPGIGFGKTVDQNLELIHRLGEIRALGYPVVLGASRKSFIGRTLNLPPDQRLEGTAAAVAVGIARGADIVRVHDVEFMVRLCRMTDALVRRGLGGGS